METLFLLIISDSVFIIIISVIVFISRNWILNKIQYSVKFQYDKRIEELKDEYSKRSRAALIADLLSEWLSYPEKQKTLNKLTFEAFLWLPEEIAKKISLRLSNNQNSPEIQEIIVDVRRFLLQTKDSVEPKDIIIFDQENIKRKKEWEKENLVK
jgi:dihydroneopterin aldolase